MNGLDPSPSIYVLYFLLLNDCPSKQIQKNSVYTQMFNSIYNIHMLHPFKVIDIQFSVHDFNRRIGLKDFKENPETTAVLPWKPAVPLSFFLPFMTAM